MAFLGQGVLWLLAGARRDQNHIYKLFKLLTSPVTHVTRAFTPRIVLDQHIGMVSFLLLMVIWLALVVFKANACVQLGYPQLVVPGC